MSLEDYMYTTMKNLIHDESGAAAIEYALIAGLIAVAIILALTNLGGELVEVFTDVEEELATIDRTAPPAAD